MAPLPCRPYSTKVPKLFRLIIIIIIIIIYSLIKYKYVLHMTVHELDKQGY